MHVHTHTAERTLNILQLAYLRKLSHANKINTGLHKSLEYFEQ